MDTYPLFLIIATATVLSPGPGVLLTLTNAIRYGTSGAIGGILGLTCGIFIVAGVSATGLGVLLATSTVAFSIMKFVGALYLVYLGVKLWRSPGVRIATSGRAGKSRKRQFIEGLTLQLTNPKAVFFFMSVFPQFVDFSEHYAGRFVLLVATYSSLLLVIHLIYATLARSLRTWLSSDKGGRLVNKLSGGTFIGFGIGLAMASK